MDFCKVVQCLRLSRHQTHYAGLHLYTLVHPVIRWYDTAQAVSHTMHSIYLTSCMLLYRALLEIGNMQLA